MAQQHLITAERFIISYDDAFYQFNPYSSAQRSDLESPTWELVQLSNSTPIIRGYAGVGTMILVTTNVSAGTNYMGLPRMVVANA